LQSRVIDYYGEECYLDDEKDREEEENDDEYPQPK